LPPLLPAPVETPATGGRMPALPELSPAPLLDAPDEGHKLTELDALASMEDPAQWASFPANEPAQVATRKAMTSTALPELPTFDQKAFDAAKGLDKDARLNRQIEGIGKQFAADLFGGPRAALVAEETDNAGDFLRQFERQRGEAMQGRQMAGAERHKAAELALKGRGLDSKDAWLAYQREQSLAKGNKLSAPPMLTVKEPKADPYLEKRLEGLDLKNAILKRNLRGGALGKKQDGPTKADIYARKQEEGLPYGYELMPRANPSKEQREKVAKLYYNKNAVVPLVAKLRPLVSDPTNLIEGNKNAKMIKTIIQQIGGKVRDMEGLGVPSGKDMEMQAQVMGDPESKWNAMIGATLPLLDQFDFFIGNNFDAGLKTYGIRKWLDDEQAAPGGQTVQASFQPGTAPASGKPAAQPLPKNLDGPPIGAGWSEEEEKRFQELQAKAAKK